MINGNFKIFNSCEKTLINSLMTEGIKKSRVGIIKDLIFIRNTGTLNTDIINPKASEGDLNPDAENEGYYEDYKTLVSDTTEIVKYYAVSALEKLKMMSDEEYMAYDFAG